MTKGDLDLICKNFSYDPDTGVVRRIAGVNKFIGKEAITTTKADCSLAVKLNKKLYRAHRVAWALHYGCWPLNDIDHINGNASDNRISNLRDVTKSVNQQNKRKPRSDNQTGFLGVKKASNSSGFIAQITVLGKVKYLGIFKTPEQASEAYLAAKRILHPGCTI